MAQVLVRHLDDDVKAALQQRARRHGHRMEQEIRNILRQALADEGAAPSRLGSRIAARFACQGLIEDLPELRGQVSQVDIHDTQIAGIALARRASIATGNLRHFVGLTVPVVSPWGGVSASPA